MATTSVKGVGSVMDLSVAAKAISPVKPASGDFQSVFNAQTGTGSASENKAQAVKNKGKDARPGDDLRAGHRNEQKVRKSGKDAAENGEVTGPDPERAAEAVNAAAAELIAQIADTFGISEEAVSDMMSELSLTAGDLMNPDSLNALLLAASGADDSLSLLTDEQLYSDFQMLMEEGQKAFEAVGEELGLSAQQLADALDDMRQMPDGGEVSDAAALLQSADDGQPDITVQNAQSGEKGSETAAKDGSDKKDAQGSNLVLETIREQAFEPALDQVQESTDTRGADTSNIMRQIMDYMRVSLKPDMSDLEMQLHPASLGTLQIHLSSKGGMVTANFVTQNEAVKAAVESQLIQLKESFEQQGVKVQAIEVTVQTHQFEENLEQGRGRQPEETGDGRRPRTRRIRLDGVSAEEIADEVSEEDRITAEMMAANGTTVDFTA